MLEKSGSNLEDKLRNGIVYLLFAIAFFIPLVPNVGTALIYVTLAFAIAKMMIARRWEIKKPPAAWLFYGFIFCSILSIYNSPIKEFSILNWIYTVGSYMIVYFLTLTYIDTYEKKKTLLLTAIGTAVVACIWGLIQYSQVYGVSSQSWVDPNTFPLIKRRLYGTLQNPNLMGAYLLEILAFVGPLALLHKKMKQHWLAKLVALFLVLCIVLTYSRGVWISCAVMVLYWGLVWKRKLLLSLLAVPAVMFYYHGGVAERLWSLFGHHDTSVSMRYALWDSTTYMIKDHPFLGIGWGSYWKVYPEYNYFLQDPSVVIYHAHNMFLHMVATIGIVGALCFIGILVVHAWKAFSLPTNKKNAEIIIKYGLTAMILGICVSGCVDYELFSHQISVVFWQMLALGACIIKAKTDND